MAFAAKLAFVHRLLWARNVPYRGAVLLGPPPLIGGALAAVLWFSIHPRAVQPDSGAQIPWAHHDKPVPQGDQPYAEKPVATLPPPRVGGFAGFRTGWQGGILPITLDATLDANVLGTVLASFDIDRPDIPISLILDAGPPKGLFVGTAKTLLAVRVAGRYAISVRLHRPAAQSANCLVRLSSSKHRMVRNINVNMNGNAVVNYAPTEFQFDPGLYLIVLAVGCWRGDQMVGPGTVDLMIRHPGETSLVPARADEVVRPVPKT